MIFPAMKALVSISAVLALASLAQAQTILTDGDTKIRNSQPNATAGSAGWLHTNSSTRALFSFDTSGLAGPVSARLEVMIVGQGVRSAGPVAVYQLNSAWDEDTVTWNTAPSAGTRITSVNIPADAADTVVSFDVSALVNTWLTNPAQNFGLMLQPDSGSTDVVFRSRESQGGSFPARLVITATGPPPSQPSGGLVTVAQQGGDYTSPLDALNNLDSGDQWCREPPVGNAYPEAHCVIEIGPGIYELDRSLVLPSRVTLRGYGPFATSLNAMPGVQNAIVVEREASQVVIERMTARNAYGDGSQSVSILVDISAGTIELRDITARAAGSLRNIAVFHRVFASVKAHNLEAVAEGGIEAIGILYDKSSNELRDSSVVATGATTNIGIGFDSSDSSPALLDVWQTNVRASGGENSIGINFSLSEGGRLRLQGGSISAFGGSTSNTALRIGGYETIVTAQGTEFMIRNGRGADNVAVGIFLGSPHSEDIRFSGITATSVGDALRIIDTSGGGARIIVHNSFLEAGDAAVRMLASSVSDVDILGSVLTGNNASLINELTGEGVVTVSHTKLDGPFVDSGSPAVVCASVVDSNGILFTNTCPP